MNTLEPRQRRFVAEYLKDLNATQAAIRAGYSKRTAKQQGQRLLTKADVRAAVEAGKAKRAAKTGVTVEYVVTKLQKIVEDAMADNDRANANRSLELLGKHVGAFVDRLDISGNLSSLSDEEIDKRIADLLAASSEA